VPSVDSAVSAIDAECTAKMEIWNYGYNRHGFTIQLGLATSVHRSKGQVQHLGLGTSDYGLMFKDKGWGEAPSRLVVVTADTQRPTVNIVLSIRADRRDGELDSDLVTYRLDDGQHKLTRRELRPVARLTCCFFDAR